MITSIDRKNTLEEFNDYYLKIKKRYEKSTAVNENNFQLIENYIFQQNTSKVKYNKAKSTFFQKLSIINGIYPNNNLSIKFLNNEITVDELINFEQKLINPRIEIQHTILNMILKHNKLDMNDSKELALKIENSCFKQCVNYCSTKLLIIVRWTNPEFMNYYSSKCGEIISLLDIDSPSCKNYGNMLLDKIVNGEILAENIGNMSIVDICEKTYEEEKKILDIRLAQKIKIKTSVLFRCPHCGARKCSYTVVQRRSLDEAPDYDCICLECSRRF